MRALIAGNDEFINDKIREVLSRSGFDCRESDVTSLDTAAEVSARARRALTVLVLPTDPQRGIELVRDIRHTNEGMLLAVGPASDPRFILQALRSGADEYLDENELDTELEGTLVRLKTKRQTRSQSGKVISILAPSGGSGASNLAANLAAVLARKHGKVGLLDMCLSSGDLTSLLDLQPTHTLAELCRNADRMDQIMVEKSTVRHESGVHLLAAPKNHHDVRHVNQHGVRQVINLARGAFPITLIDLDRTLTPEQIPAVVQADLLLLVLRLDMTSLQNTQRVLDRMDELGVTKDRVRVVANRYRQPRELPAGKAEQALGVELFHCIPDDPATVNLAVNKGVPMVSERPRAKVSKSLVELATKISNLPSRHDRTVQPEAASQPTGWFANSATK